MVNPYMAQARLKSLRRYLPVSQNKGDDGNIPDDVFGRVTADYGTPSAFSTDREESMRMLLRMEEIIKTLPQIDCGSCGAPTCRAFANDVVRGRSDISECVVFMREELKKLHEKPSP